MTDNTQLLRDILPFLIPVALLELGLMIFALVDLVKRKRVTGGNKVVWVLLVVLVQIVGPVVYLLVGRKEDSVGSDKD